MLHDHCHRTQKRARLGTRGDEQKIRLAVSPPPRRSGGERVSHASVLRTTKTGSLDVDENWPPIGQPASSSPRSPSATVQCASGERLAIRFSTDPETGVASGVPEAAICVQDLDVQCVLQFTLINAAGCALHRRTNRVIHRQECFHVRPLRRRRSTEPTESAAVRLATFTTFGVPKR